MDIKRRRIFIVCGILFVCFVILFLADGYVLSSLNYARLIEGKSPLLTRSVPDDGMGIMYYGITYLLERHYVSENTYSVSFWSRINLPFRDNSSKEESVNRPG